MSHSAGARPEGRYEPNPWRPVQRPDSRCGLLANAAMMKFRGLPTLSRCPPAVAQPARPRRRHRQPALTRHVAQEPFAAAMPTGIQRDHPITRSQPRRRLRPLPGMTSEPVQQQHRATIPTQVPAGQTNAATGHLAPDSQTPVPSSSRWPFPEAQTAGDGNPRGSRSETAIRARMRPKCVAQSPDSLPFARRHSRKLFICRASKMEPVGIEPTTSCLQSRRSPN